MSQDDTEPFHKFRVATEYVSRNGHPVSVIFNGVNANSWLSPIGINSNPKEETTPGRVVIPSRPKSTGSITIVRHHPKPSGLKRDEIVIGHHLKCRNEDDITEDQQDGNEVYRRHLPFEECQGHVGSFLFNQRVMNKGYKGGGFCDGPSKRPRPFTSGTQRLESSIRTATPSLELTVRSFDLYGRLVSQREEKAKHTEEQKQSLNANAYEELSKTCVKRAKSAPPRPTSSRSTKTPLYWRAKSAYHRKTVAPASETYWDTGESIPILRGSMLRPLLYSSVQDIQHSAGCPYKCKGCFRACLVSQDYLEKSRSAQQPARKVRDLRYRSFVKKDPRYILHRALARNQPIYKLVHGYCDEKTVKEAWDDGGTIRGQADGDINLDNASVLGSPGISMANEDQDSFCDISSQGGVLVETQDPVDSRTSTLSRLSRTDSYIHLQPSKYWFNPTRRVRSAESEKRGDTRVVPPRSKSCSEAGELRRDYISMSLCPDQLDDKPISQSSGTPGTTDTYLETSNVNNSIVNIMSESSCDLQDEEKLDHEVEDDGRVSEMSSNSEGERKGSVDGRSVLSDDSFGSETLSITRDTTSHGSLSDDEKTLSERDVSETSSSSSGHSTRTLSSNSDRPSVASSTSENHVNTVRNDSYTNVGRYQNEIDFRRNSHGPRINKQRKVTNEASSDQNSQRTTSRDSSIDSRNNSISASSELDTDRGSYSESVRSESACSTEYVSDKANVIRQKREVEKEDKTESKLINGKLGSNGTKAKLFRQRRKEHSLDNNDGTMQDQKEPFVDSEERLSTNASTEITDTSDTCDDVKRALEPKNSKGHSEKDTNQYPRQSSDTKTNKIVKSRSDIIDRKVERSSLSRILVKPSFVAGGKARQNDRLVSKSSHNRVDLNEENYYSSKPKEEISTAAITLQGKDKLFDQNQSNLKSKNESSRIRVNKLKKRSNNSRYQDNVQTGLQERRVGSSPQSSTDDNSAQTNETEDSTDTEVTLKSEDSGTSASGDGRSDSGRKTSCTNDTGSVFAEDSDHESNSD